MSSPKDKERKEEKYLEYKIALIRATVAGTIIGAILWGREEDSSKYTENAMKKIEKDVRNIFNYAKKQKDAQ